MNFARKPSVPSRSASASSQYELPPLPKGSSDESSSHCMRVRRGDGDGGVENNGEGDGDKRLCCAFHSIQLKPAGVSQSLRRDTSSLASKKSK
eukprot:4278221-Pleurochrysis_carterae.AAC.2